MGIEADIENLVEMVKVLTAKVDFLSKSSLAMATRESIAFSEDEDVISAYLSLKSGGARFLLGKEFSTDSNGERFFVRQARSSYFGRPPHSQGQLILLTTKLRDEVSELVRAGLNIVIDESEQP